MWGERERILRTRTRTQQPRDTIFRTASELIIICFHLLIFPGVCCCCFGLSLSLSFRSIYLALLHTDLFALHLGRTCSIYVYIYIYVYVMLCLFCITFSFASLLSFAMNLLLFHLSNSVAIYQVHCISFSFFFCFVFFFHSFIHLIYDFVMFDFLKQAKKKKEIHQKKNSKLFPFFWLSYTNTKIHRLMDA